MIVLSDQLVLAILHAPVVASKHVFAQYGKIPEESDRRSVDSREVNVNYVRTYWANLFLSPFLHMNSFFLF